MKDYISSPLSPSNKKMTIEKMSPTSTPIRKKLFDTQSPINNNNNTTTPARNITSVFRFASNSIYGNKESNSITNSVTKQQQQQQPQFKPIPSLLSTSSENVTIPEDKVPMSVYLRIRPLSKEEVKSKESNCFTVLNTNSVSIKSTRSDSDSNKFSFSSVLPPTTNQPQLFKTITYPLIQSFLNGHNILLLAYGVTNAGKTYTISGSKSNPGIIPRSLELIFKSIPSQCLKKNENLILNQTGTTNNSSKELLNNIDSSDDEYTKVVDSQDSSDDENDDDENNDESTTTSKIINSTNLMDSFINNTPAKSNTVGGEPIQMSDQFNYAIWISYYEIHKKNIHDLLDDSPTNSKKPQLKIESENATVNIKGLKEVLVSSVEDARDIIEQGELNRKVGGTKLNKKSSRSHAVLTIKLFTSPRNLPKSEIHPSQIRCSKLCIIDLAGSERASRTETTGERLKEASNINTSLFILGKCIEGLKQQALQQQQQLLNSASKIKRQSVYLNNPNNNNNIIPWRESDLTRVCQEYFCGNGKAAMIVNVSPTGRDSEETLNVLRFSANAKEITTQSKIKPMVYIPPTPMTLKKRKSMEQSNNLATTNNTTTTNAIYNISQLQNSVNEIRKKIHLDSLLSIGQPLSSTVTSTSSSTLSSTTTSNNNKFIQLDYISMEKDQLLDKIQIYQRKISDYEIKIAENEVILRQQFSNDLVKSYLELEAQYKDKILKESQLIYDRLQSKLSLIKNVNKNQNQKLNNQISKLELQLQQQQQQQQKQQQNNENSKNNNKRSDDEWILEITEIQTERDHIQSKLNSITFELDEQRQSNQNSNEKLKQFIINTETIELEKQQLRKEIESMQTISQELFKKREFEMMQLKEFMNSEAQRDRENLEIQYSMETNNLNNQLHLERKEKQLIIEELNKLKKELQQYVSIEYQRNNNCSSSGSNKININQQQFNHPILANAQYSTPIKVAPNKFSLKATPSKSLIKNILGAHSNSPFKNANIENSVGGGYKVQLNLPVGSPIQLAPGTPNSISNQTPDRLILDPNQYGDSGLLMKEIDDEDYLNLTGGGNNNTSTAAGGEDHHDNYNDDDNDDDDDNDTWLDINISDNDKKPKKSKSFGTLKRIKDKTIAVALISANIASSALNSSINNNTSIIEKEEKEKKVLKKVSSRSSISSRKSSKSSLTSSSSSNSKLTTPHNNLTPIKNVIPPQTTLSSQSTILSPISPSNNGDIPTSPVMVHVASSTRAPIDPPPTIPIPTPTPTTTTKTTKKTLESIKDTPKKIANIFSSKSKSTTATTASTSTRPKRTVAATNSTFLGSEVSPIEIDNSPPRITRKPPIPIVSKSTTASTTATTKKSSSSSSSSTTSSLTTTLPTKRTRKIVDEKKNYLEEVDEIPIETPRKALGLRPRSKIVSINKR